MKVTFLRWASQHLLSVGLLVMLSSCASDPIKSITEFVTTPIVPQTSRTPGTATQPQRGSDVCDRLEFTSAMDVDSAYANAMRSFGFRTTEERKRAAERMSIGMIDDGFRHTAQPGAFYRMADYNDLVQDGRKFALWTKMELWRETAQQTKVKVEYCGRSSVEQAVMKESLRTAYRAPFK